MRAPLARAVGPVKLSGAMSDGFTTPVVSSRSTTQAES